MTKKGGVATGHPPGWVPGVEFDPGARQGKFVSKPQASNSADFDQLLAEWGFDPRIYRIDEDLGVQVRTWLAPIGDGQVEQMWYFRGTVKYRTASALDPLDIDALVRQVGRRRPAPARRRYDSGRSLIINASDWQLGKGPLSQQGAVGGGTAATVARVEAQIARIPAHVAELELVGRPVDRIVILNLGDAIEQCTGHYANQAFTVDCDRRTQMRLARRLFLRLVDVCAPLASEVWLSGVAANHGEQRVDGKAITGWTDNDDLAVLEQVGEIVERTPEQHGHVRVILPDSLELVLPELDGVTLGAIHGHQVRKSGPAGAALAAWLQGQAGGRTPIGDVDILVSGHRHHFVYDESIGRPIFQCPASDGGSYWFESQTGARSPSGLLSFCVGDGCGPRGWSDVRIL